ncbi:Elicitin [Phytophthora cactorum]|nr:Elicitin [Phytophthora cactorum]
MSSSGSITTCSSTSLAGLLTNQYITQCSTDSGYSFTAASIPTQDVIDLMCASSACRGLLADAQALDLPECILPVGDNIRLRADLIDYVPARCPSASGSATAGSTATTDSTSRPAPRPVTTPPAPPTPSRHRPRPRPRRRQARRPLLRPARRPRKRRRRQLRPQLRPRRRLQCCVVGGWPGAERYVLGALAVVTYFL